MLHGVETTFRGASFACSFGVFLLRVSAACFRSCFRSWSSRCGLTVCVPSVFLCLVFLACPAACPSCVFPLACSAQVFRSCVPVCPSFAWSSLLGSFAWSSFLRVLHVFTWQKQTRKEFHGVPMCILYRYPLQAQGKRQAQGIAEGCARWNSVGASRWGTMAGVPLERGARGGHGG